MSEKEKTGEDLIEKVEQQTAETTEETKEAAGFDPKAFASAEEYVENKSQDTKEESKEEPESAEEAEESNDDDFSWDNVEVEKEEKEEEEQEEDWDVQPESEKKEEEKKEETKEAPYDWETLAGEIGIKANDEKSFKVAVKQMLDNPAPVSDTITQLQDFLKMGDRGLVEADLEASGLEKKEIKDTVDRMQDSGLLKREALMLRKNLQNYVANEIDRLR